MTLTEEQQIAYIENNGNKCPVCGAEDLDSGLTEFDGTGMMYQGIYCKKCRSAWTDMFTLVGIDGERTDLCRTENGGEIN